MHRSNIFLDMSPKAKEREVKIHKWDRIKRRSSAQPRTPTKWKGSLRNGKKHCQECDGQGVHMQNIKTAYATLYQKKKNTNNSIQKMDKRHKQKFLQWRHWWSTGTRKDAQYHQLLETCTSQPQGGITSHQAQWPQSQSLQRIKAGQDMEKRGNPPTWLLRTSPGVPNMKNHADLP